MVVGDRIVADGMNKVWVLVMDTELGTFDGSVFDSWVVINLSLDTRL